MIKKMSRAPTPPPFESGPELPTDPLPVPPTPKPRPTRVPSKAEKLNWTERERREKKQAILDAIPQHGTLYHSAQAAGVSLTTVSRWLREDEEFAAAMIAAKRIPGHMIERVAMRRALDMRINADPLRVFLLKNLLKDEYGETDRINLEIHVQDILVSYFVNTVQKAIPEVCPHCKSHLGLSESLARELKGYSERLLRGANVSDPTE